MPIHSWRPVFFCASIVMTSLPQIRGYESLRSLGGGPLTLVFEVRRISDDYICTIKTPRDDWAIHDAAVRLLRREYRALREVRHPNLVRILDAGFSDTSNYLVLEYLEGETLRERLQHDYSLSVRNSVWIGRQIAEALTALHRAGYIHGDVKPENILLTKHGPAVLIDLGFARYIDETWNGFDAGLGLGTPNYLAPELTSDKPRVSPASDWYSFGVTLFEMLTGGLPNRNSSLRTGRLPPRLSSLIDRLLSPLPSARPAGSVIMHELIALEIETLGQRRAA